MKNYNINSTNIYIKPKIEAIRIDKNTILFKHSKQCQCKTCIQKWIDTDPYYGRNEI